MKNSPLRFLTPSVLAILGAAFISSVQAGTVTWVGGSSVNWNPTSANWAGTGTTRFTNGDDVVFNDSGLTPNPTITVQGTVTSVGAMSVLNTSGTYSFAGLINGSTLFKSGAGTLLFTGNSPNQPLFPGGVTLAGGTLMSRAIFTANINVTGNATLAGEPGQGSPSFSGTITGSSQLTINPADATRSVTLSGDLSGFTGTLKSSADGIVNLTTSASNLSNAKVDLAGNTNLQFAVSTLQIGQINTVATNTIAKGTNNTTSTLEIGALNNASSIAGVITNNGVGITNATVALNKVGTGTLTLSGANTYSGQTQVNVGTLIVNGTHIEAAAVSNNGYGSSTNGHYLVASGATLGGTGRISGNNSQANSNMVLVQSGGVFAPGSSIGTTVLDGTNITGAGSHILSMASGADFTFELAGNGLSSDSINFWGYGAGDVLLNANEINLSLSGPLVAGTYTVTLFRFYSDAGTTLTGSGLTSGLVLGTIGANISGTPTLNYNAGGNTIDLTYTVVPEPATIGLLGLGAMLALGRRRRA